MQDTDVSSVESVAPVAKTNPAATLARDSVKTVIFASMIGTAIEFYDFYAYGTAAAAYFPKVFFPEVTPTIAVLLSLLTFGVAFVARPLGSLVFGHFGDKIGRKNTLIVSLLLMGCSTVLIGVLQGIPHLALDQLFYCVPAGSFKVSA